MALRNHTLFISGASRGIGKAIGLRAAQDGANIIIAAKTADPHPKLPGTIYTAADEIEKAGGKALPCIVDIRSEQNVREAVDKARKEFGKIDILVNNASAISLTPSLVTGMKKYDLMNQINARGTYLCSHVCAPDLIKSAAEGKFAHILNIAPPLSFNEIWFKNHTAYTIAKFGMSMCTLGMAGEFRDRGVGVNSLWPRTAIWTAAMKMISGGDDATGNRTPEIMSDAAHVMLTSNPKDFTGNFVIDEEILREKCGIQDFTKYDCVPGSPLTPDFFIDDYEKRFGKIEDGAAVINPNVGQDAAAVNTVPSTVEQVMNNLSHKLSQDGATFVQKTNASYHFIMKDSKREFFLNLAEGNGKCGQLSAGESIEASSTFTMKEKDFVKMFNGKINAQMAFMTGQMKIKGDLQKAMKLEKLMKAVR